MQVSPTVLLTWNHRLDEIFGDRSHGPRSKTCATLWCRDPILIKIGGNSTCPDSTFPRLGQACVSFGWSWRPVEIKREVRSFGHFTGNVLDELVPMITRRISGVFPASLLLVALAMTSVLPNTGFRSPPRFDGAGYALLGLSLSSGLGYREGSHPDMPPHTHFPPVYPLVLSGLYRTSGTSFPAAHALSAAFTVAATIAFWCWFRRIYPSRTALLLGSALAINWTWGRMGGAIQSEPLYCLLSALALLAASGPRANRPQRGLLLGLLFAASILTRHVGVCLVAAVILDMLLRRRVALAVVTLVTTSACLVPWLAWLHRVGQWLAGQLIRV